MRYVALPWNGAWAERTGCDFGLCEVDITYEYDCAFGDEAASDRLANAAFASGDRDGAAETLLRMVAADREWNDGAARAKLLSLFEAVGLEDPWVAAQRRRLSLILFG